MTKPKPCHCCFGTGRECDMKHFGKLMRQHRVLAGISLRKMAAAVGITPSFLSNLENGKRRWTLSVINKIESVLNETIRHQKPKTP